MVTHGILPRGNCVRDRFHLGLVGYNYGVHSHCHVYKVTAGHSSIEVASRWPLLPLVLSSLSLHEGAGLEVMWECEHVLQPQGWEEWKRKEM